MATTSLDTAAILDVVKLQPPVLLLDSAEVDPETQTVTAVKAVSPDEPAFEGHFPEHPILPGVMQIEAMRQASLVALATLGDWGHMTYMHHMAKAKFRSPVAPGDRLDVTAQIVEQSDEAVTLVCAATVDGKVTSEARLSFSAPKPETPLETCKADQEILPGYHPKTTDEIKAIIPHRPPFLFIDRLVHLPDDGREDEETISVKSITRADTYLAPEGGDIVPPAFLVEVAAQTGCAYLLKLPQNEGKLGFFLSIDVAEFHRYVHVGDEIVAKVKILSLKKSFGKCEGRVYVNGELVGRSDVKFAFVEA